MPGGPGQSLPESSSLDLFDDARLFDARFSQLPDDARLLDARLLQLSYEFFDGRVGVTGHPFLSLKVYFLSFNVV